MDIDDPYENRHLLKPFDAFFAVTVERRFHVKAHRPHRCDGPSMNTMLSHHDIRPGEHYELTRLVDRTHGSFETFRVCEWCQHGESRVEEWIPVEPVPVPGHHLVRHGDGDWRCACGVSLRSWVYGSEMDETYPDTGRRGARDAMRFHRMDLAMARERPPIRMTEHICDVCHRPVSEHSPTDEETGASYWPPLCFPVCSCGDREARVVGL